MRNSPIKILNRIRRELNLKEGVDQKMTVNIRYLWQNIKSNLMKFENKIRIALISIIVNTVSKKQK